MAYQYKIGDKVRIKEREGSSNDYPTNFIDEMAELHDYIFTICNIYPNSLNTSDIRCIFFNGDYNTYAFEGCDINNWHSSMFELVEEGKIGNPTKIVPLLTQANLGDSVIILGTRGCIDMNSHYHYFIRFASNTETHKTIAKNLYTVELKELAYDFNALSGYSLSPHFKSIMSLIAFVNEVNLRYKPKESIKQSTITPKTLNENEIRFQKPEAIATGGFVPTGHPIRGREHKVTVVIGHLSNQKISC